MQLNTEVYEDLNKANASYSGEADVITEDVDMGDLSIKVSGEGGEHIRIYGMNNVIEENGRREFTGKKAKEFHKTMITHNVQLSADNSDSRLKLYAEQMAAKDKAENNRVKTEKQYMDERKKANDMYYENLVRKLVGEMSSN